MVQISDKELIKILLEDGRKPYLRIAKQLNVTEAAVRKRVKKLIEEGKIKRFTIEIDPTSIGVSVVAIIGVDTKPEFYVKIIDFLKKHQAVVRLYTASGDHMILAECWFSTPNSFEKFIETLEENDGVIKVCPAIITQRIK